MVFKETRIIIRARMTSGCHSSGPKNSSSMNRTIIKTKIYFGKRNKLVLCMLRTFGRLVTILKIMKTLLIKNMRQKIKGFDK